MELWMEVRKQRRGEEVGGCGFRGWLVGQPWRRMLGGNSLSEGRREEEPSGCWGTANEKALRRPSGEDA